MVLVVACLREDVLERELHQRPANSTLAVPTCEEGAREIRIGEVGSAGLRKTCCVTVDR